ncbi:hypothetical protein B0H16DRAFT_768372 [Mycena metata]|uniref:Secreted protein n=1 Tax=Mycena metata TaxID=1033252 RepID=A0AAD7IZ38_9AGAR|nr:hypothetical protein B0H16DRAFT_768372 [Mycena metata]
MWMRVLRRCVLTGIWSCSNSSFLAFGSQAGWVSTWRIYTAWNELWLDFDAHRCDHVLRAGCVLRETALNERIRRPSWQVEPLCRSKNCGTQILYSTSKLGRITRQHVE